MAPYDFGDHDFERRKARKAAEATEAKRLKALDDEAGLLEASIARYCSDRGYADVTINSPSDSATVRLNREASSLLIGVTALSPTKLFSVQRDEGIVDQGISEKQMMDRVLDFLTSA